MAETETQHGGRSNRLLVAIEGFVLAHRLPVSIAVHILLFMLALLLAHVVRFEIANASRRNAAEALQSKVESALIESLTGEAQDDRSAAEVLQSSLQTSAHQARRMVRAIRGSVASIRRPVDWWGTYFVPWLPIFVVLKLLIFGKMRLYRGAWHYSSIRDVGNIVVASWWFLFIMFPLVMVCRYLLPRGEGPFAQAVGFVSNQPAGVLLLDFIITVFLLCTARLGFRLYHEEFRLRPESSEGVARVLIVGSGNAAETVIREISRMTVERYRVVGIADDDPAKQKMLIYGVPVLGTPKEIPRICEENDIDEILIALPSATRKQLRSIVQLCEGTKLRYRYLPGVTELIDGKVTVSQIRPVDINDLLGREAVELDLEALARFLADRTVLITGAGGSIGAEMCRQACRHGPKSLVLLEQAETPLFDVQNELARDFPEIPTVDCVCDIYDRDRVFAVWDRYRPDVVIHAAAHKHVPLMEHNPSEAIKNNVLGTRNVADASCEYGAAEFVMISTDKAVNPSSIMGVSKRVAEIYTQSLNGRGGCQTQFKAVRFGNVLGSNGSVVPTFRRQIDRGGPVTVTHPDMTRYFMTIPEAAQLVLQAAATGEGGQIFLLDMGEPVKIVDLARNMITLSGLRPGEDIDIVFTGCRPGEKLFEELRTDGEDIEATVHPKILVWKHCASEWKRVQGVMEQMQALANCFDRNRIIRAFRDAVPEYTPLNPPTDRSRTDAADDEADRMGVPQPADS